MTKSFLITSAAGRVGKEVTARLREAYPDAFIRAGCRRPGKAEFLKDLGVDEVVELDYNNVDTYGR